MNREKEIELAIRAFYPDAEIIAYYQTTGEMTFYPYPDDDMVGSCVCRNGRYVIKWDF